MFYLEFSMHISMVKQDIVVEDFFYHAHCSTLHSVRFCLGLYPSFHIFQVKKILILN